MAIVGEQLLIFSLLQDLFLVEAAKYNVLPLDDRVGERFNAAIAGAPIFPVKEPL